MPSLPSLLRNQILSVIYTVQTFQSMYTRLLNLHRDTGIALKNGGPHLVCPPPAKKYGAKDLRPPLPTSISVTEASLKSDRRREA